MGNWIDREGQELRRKDICMKLHSQLVTSSHQRDNHLLPKGWPCCMANIGHFKMSTFLVFRLGCKFISYIYLFIVCIGELTAHGSFGDNHKWIHTVDWSIQTKPQSFILVVVVSILMYVSRRRWHERKKKPTLTALFETRCTMTGWVFLKPILQ